MRYKYDETFGWKHKCDAGGDLARVRRVACCLNSVPSSQSSYCFHDKHSRVKLR